MLDARDFDAWWAREIARNDGVDLGADAKHWAHAGFIGAAILMTQHLRAQKERVKADAELRKGNQRARLLDSRPGYSLPMQGFIRSLAQTHEANLPAAELAALMVKRAQSKR